MFEHMSNLQRSYAIERKRREVVFRKELSVGCFVAVQGNAPGEFCQEKKFIGMEDARWMAVEVTIEDGGKLGDAHFIAGFFAGFASGSD